MTELFFDTETTGLARFKEHYSNPDQPKMVQFGAILSDGPQRILNEVNILVTCPCDVPAAAEKVHGISREMTENFGINEVTTCHLIRQLFAAADVCVAHNVAFDKVVVCHSMHNHLGEPAAKKAFFANFFCTMLATTDIVKLPGRYGNYKWPTLQELHKFLFNEEFSGAHDAMADVRALRRCYYELKERKLV